MYTRIYYTQNALSIGIFILYCHKNSGVIRDPRDASRNARSIHLDEPWRRRTIFRRGGRDACVDVVTSRRSIRRRRAVVRSGGVGALFPGWFEGLSRGGVAFPTTDAREYVLNRRGWGVSSSSTSKIRQSLFRTGDNFRSGFIRVKTVVLGVVSFGLW